MDTTDMPKQGMHSVGVARQYCSRLGQVTNCRAGVFVTYAKDSGATLVYRRQFLTEAATFRTKPQLALKMLTELVAEGSLPARWVTCDEGYGQSVDFLDGVTTLGLGYMVEVPVDTRIWPERPPTIVPRTRPRLVPGTPTFLKTRALAAHLTGARWAIETSFREGKQLLGLGDYEGCSWQGWHRHMTLCAPALLPAAGQAGTQKK